MVDKKYLVVCKNDIQIWHLMTIKHLLKEAGLEYDVIQRTFIFKTIEDRTLAKLMLGDVIKDEVWNIQ